MEPQHIPLRSTAAPTTSAAGYEELRTLTYTGPVPHPHPPCLEPTPDEQYRIDVQDRQRALANEEMSYKSQESQEATARARFDAPDAGDDLGDAAHNTTAANRLFDSASGLFTSVKSVANQVALNLKKGANEVSSRTQAQARQMDHQINASRYRAAFPDVARSGETLLASYRCAAMHGGARVMGMLFVTSHHILFHAQTSSSLATATDAIRSAIADPGTTSSAIHGVKQVIPLVQVASVQLSVALATLDEGPPYFMLRPAPHVLPTALQIYSPQGNKLFQFLDFDTVLNKTSEILAGEDKGTPLERAYNYIDHAWRDSVAVPLQGVTYDKESVKTTA